MWWLLGQDGMSWSFKMGRGCSWWHSQRGGSSPCLSFPAGTIPEGGWGLTLTCRTGRLQSQEPNWGFQLWADVCRGAEAGGSSSFRRSVCWALLKGKFHEVLDQKYFSPQRCPLLGSPCPSPLQCEPSSFWGFSQHLYSRPGARRALPSLNPTIKDPKSPGWLQP